MKNFKSGSAAIIVSIHLVVSLLCVNSNEQVAFASGFQSSETAKLKQESEFDAKRREGLSKNPQDTSFTIRLDGDKKQFKQGEIIRLDLRFASSRAKIYRLDAAAYDRSGRLDMDHFHINPESGFVDPMRGYLGGLGGGLRRIPELEEKPYVITYEINEWFRFDKPGKYQLYLTSPRVSRIGKREEAESLILTSNAVEFEIVQADREWQAKELQRIIKELDAKDPKSGRRAACRTLRFLGSKASAVELVRRYDDSDGECGFEYYAGLVSSPHRDFIIEAMESQLAAPEQPISSGWLNLIIRLSMDRGHPEFQEPVSQDEGQWREYWKRHQDAYAQIQSKYAGRLAQSIQSKTGRAKAVSINTLLETKWDKTKLPAVASFFNDLPIQQQRMLLEYRWKQIASDSLLPTLRQLYKKRQDGNSEENYEIEEINTLALKRIYELSPVEGRGLIIAEMKRVDPRAGLPALTILPDETLPELDHTFVDHFEKSKKTELHSALIERYGSPAIFTRVKALLNERVGNMPCYEQSHLLAYCFRIDPPGTIELIRRELTARGEKNSRCYPNVFRGVGELHESPELEKLAIEYLNDPDPEVVIDAVAMLGQNGSADAEETLWQRFEKWHREWSGREQELNTDFRHDDPIQWQAGLEQALRIALSQSPAWLADLKKLERINRLCVTQNARQQVDYSIQEWSSEISLRFAPAEHEWGSLDVAHYHLTSLSGLKKKLAQFPRGTVFKWQPFNEGHLEEEKEKLFRELDSFLGERSLRLVK